jgi:hypothetical protein
LAEDLFASYLADHLKHETFLVNQQFFCQKIREKIKLDVSIIREGVIVGLIDVKMDAGFKRTTLGDFCQWQDARIGALRGKVVRTYDGVTKVGAEYLLAKDAIYHIILVSRLNIRTEILKLAEDRCRDLTAVELYSLSDIWHPNAYGHSIETIMAGISVLDNEFKRLVKALQSPNNASTDNS